jgi:hypothetical protein
MTKSIESARLKITALQRERMALEQQKASRAEVRAKVAALVNGWEEAAVKRSGLQLLWMARDGHDSGLARADIGDAGYDGLYAVLGPLLVSMLGAEHVTNCLLAGIESVPESLDKPARLARIAAINLELDRLEAEEEGLICAAEAQGLQVLRRPNARPEVILAVTHG